MLASEPGGAETVVVKLSDRAAHRVHALTADPVRLRRVVTIACVVIAAWGCTVSLLADDYRTTVAYGMVPLTAVVAGVAWRLRPRHRSWLLSALSALLATTVPDALWLGVPLAAVLTLAVIDDPEPTPWLPLVATLGGAIASLVVFGYQPTPAPFVWGVIGASAGLLSRSLMRTGRLEQEAGALRGQATWLEQRTALARELHDVVGHHVTAMVVQAEAGLVADPDRALREIADVGRTALGELDALVVHLRDPDAPLATSAPPRLLDIDELLAAPLRAQGVEVTVDVDHDLVLDEVRTLAVYRIVQEALTNVARHARASAAAVDVRAVSGHLRVRVSDDGVGVPPEPERGSGLVGIGERVSAHGGFWELSQRLGGGTVLDVVLPLDRVPS